VSDRYIIIPPDAKFIDPYTREPVKVPGENGEVVDHPDRSFDWFMHVHILTHLQFSMEVGGYDAVKAAKQIAKDMEKAIESGYGYFAVSADNWRRLNRTISRAEAADADEPLKDRPNTRVLAKSSHGMTRPMTNFTALCFMEHLDAIANASTNKPEDL